MRFGRTLQLSIYGPWRDGYIDYGRLKKLLKDDDSAPGSPAVEVKDTWTDEDQTAFIDELIARQLPKVSRFHADKHNELLDRVGKCEAKLDDIAVGEVQSKDGSEGEEGTGATSSSGNGKNAMPSEQGREKILNEVYKELEAITKEMNELEKFARINYTGFLKAVKKHDRKRGEQYRVRALVNVHLARNPFHREDYSVLLYRLSALYAFVRQRLDGAERQGPRMSMSTNASIDSKDEYTSHKFLVHPDNLLELKTTIMRRLPVLVYNPQTSKNVEGHQPDPSITSIYFDNRQFECYVNKVDRDEAASLRLRWYGLLHNKPQIFVEKKTVKEDGGSKDSRLSTKEKYVQSFIKGEYHVEKQIKKIEHRAGVDSREAVELRNSTTDIQEFIKEHDLQPVLRANYSRTAFQLPDDDRVRISLDTNLVFIREDTMDKIRPCRDPDSWHRTDIDGNQLTYPFTSVRKGEMNKFPYALLEIKTKSSSRKSAWIQDIMSSHLVKEAPKFSKFAHGVAVLFDDNVNTFPFWLSDLENDIRRDPEQAFKDDQARKQKERDAEFAVGSLLKSAPSKSSMRRDGGGDILSPVGSPQQSSPLQNQSLSTSAAQRPSNLGAIADTDVDKNTTTVEQTDEDETGTREYGTLDGPQSKLSTLLNPFSTSKYGTAKREGHILPPGVTRPDSWIKDQGPVQVEAKVWLANQRTFIKWQHVSVLLATLSLGLYNAAGENNDVARALGVVYTVVAIFAGVWGYGVFIWRTRLIEGRSGRDFDARLGPVVVCVGLIVALVLNFFFKYRAVMEEQKHGGRSGVTANSTAEYAIEL